MFGVNWCFRANTTEYKIRKSIALPIISTGPREQDPCRLNRQGQSLAEASPSGWSSQTRCPSLLSQSPFFSLSLSPHSHTHLCSICVSVSAHPCPGDPNAPKMIKEVLKASQSLVLTMKEEHILRKNMHCREWIAQVSVNTPLTLCPLSLLSLHVYMYIYISPHIPNPNQTIPNPQRSLI